MATLGQIFGTYLQPKKDSQPKVVNNPLSRIVSATTGGRTTTDNRGLLAEPQVLGPAKPAQVSPFVTAQPRPQVRQPVQTPVPTPTATPTVAEMYSNVNLPTLDTGEDKVLARLTRDAQRQASQSVNEGSIRDDVMSRYQAEIDAINQIYAQQLAETKQQGLGALGSTRAIQARSGLLGSDFAQAQNQNVEAQNLAAQNTVQDEKAQRISNILGRGREEAATEIANKRKAIQEGIDSYVKYLDAAQERKQSKLAGLAQSLIDQGVRPDEISPEQIQEIAKAYGVNEQDIASAYASKERELATASPEDVTLSEGEYRFAYDPTTGTYQQVAGVPKSDSASSTLTAAQQTKADSIRNVRQQLANYKQLIQQDVGFTGGNQFGSDSARIRTAKAALEFAIANAVGTGALQAADRAVVEEIIPDPTTFFGAPDRWAKGGKQGVLDSIDEAEKIFTGAESSIGSSNQGAMTGGDSVFADAW